MSFVGMGVVPRVFDLVGYIVAYGGGVVKQRGVAAGWVKK